MSPPGLVDRLHMYYRPAVLSDPVPSSSSSSSPTPLSFYHLKVSLVSTRLRCRFLHLHSFPYFLKSRVGPDSEGKVPVSDPLCQKDTKLNQCLPTTPSLMWLNIDASHPSSCSGGAAVLRCIRSWRCSEFGLAVSMASFPD